MSDAKPEGVTEKRPPAGAWASLKAGLKRTPERKKDRGHPAFWSAHWVKTVGVPGALAFAILRALQGSLAEERLLRAEQQRALVAAIGAQGSSLATVRQSLEALSAQAQRTEGMAMGHFDCPDCSCPRCPKCPDPGPGPIVVTSSAEVVPPPPPPPSPPALERPSREGAKREQRGMPTRPRREP